MAHKVSQVNFFAAIRFNYRRHPRQIVYTFSLDFVWHSNVSLKKITDRETASLYKVNPDETNAEYSTTN